MLNKLLSGLLILSFFAIGCKHDPVNPGGPSNPDNNGSSGNDTTGTSGVPCDPDSIYFATEILPLLQSNCALSGCHDAASAEEGVVLNSYENIIRTGEITGGTLNNDLWEAITDDDPDDRMPPPPNAPLTTDQIELIRSWITQGAKNTSCDQNTDCDLTNVSWSNTIRDIITTACLGCHNTAVQNGNIDLSDYDKTKAIGQSGALLGSIKHESGYVAMPFNGSKLPACKIDQIETWIAEGFAN